jgi:hypothetical protein
METHIMANPQMPNMPGAAAMTDTLDFVKNLWGSMSVPGMNIPGITAPTMSVDELDKKINDLKAVEAWLNVNMSMLRGTVQALEVQRATIATLKSMGASLAAAVQKPGANDQSLFDSVPYASVFFQQPPAAAPKAEAAKPAPAPAKPEAAPAPTEAAPDTAAQMTNPAAWWNLLQDQFKQAVTTTMAADAIAGAQAMATEAATKFATPAKPAKPAAPAAAAKAPAKPAAAKAKATKADKP